MLARTPRQDLLTVLVLADPCGQITVGDQLPGSLLAPCLLDKRLDAFRWAGLNPNL
jgi:hypothetical protein